MAGTGPLHETRFYTEGCVNCRGTVGADDFTASICNIISPWLDQLSKDIPIVDRKRKFVIGHAAT